MIRNGFYWIYVNFHDVLRSNVQGIRKLAVKTFMCIISVPCMFGCFLRIHFV